MSASSFFTYHVGDVKVHVISDGQVVRPLSEDFVQNASIEAVRQALAEANLPTDTLTTTFAPLVLETAGRLAVVDAGLGPDAADQPGSAAGLLTRNMRAGGIDPDTIRTVIISHFHPDHVNGLVSAGTPVFRNAEVAVPGVEWRFWMDDGEMARATPGRMADLFASNRRVIESVRDRIRIYEWEDEVVPGLQAVGTPGHSVGHTSYWLRSMSERVFVQSDLTNHEALFVTHPDWSASFDQDPIAAVAVRRKIYEMLARERVPLQAFHHPFPGRAFLEKHGGGYRRVAIS